MARNHTQESRPRPSGQRDFGQKDWQQGSEPPHYGETSRPPEQQVETGTNGPAPRYRGPGNDPHRGGWGEQGAWSQGDYDEAPSGHRGRGPKGYQRSDERIRDDVCELLTEDELLDATDIEVRVSAGEVTLAGSVDSRESKRAAEQLAEQVRGVVDVRNELRLKED